MNIENTTGVRWSGIDFRIVATGQGDTNQPWTYEATIHDDHLDGDTILQSRAGCEDGFPFPLKIEKCSVSISAGTPVEEDVIAFKEAEVERKREEARDRAARKRSADAAAARTAALMKLPLLSAGTQSIFLGSDRKCAVQFQEALRMDGLDKRKRIADLVTYGCGVIADNEVRVIVEQKDGDYALGL